MLKAFEIKQTPHCSFCDSTDVLLYSTFGTAQLVRQFYCRSCRSVFEFIRWQETKADSKSDLQPST